MKKLVTLILAVMLLSPVIAAADAATDAALGRYAAPAPAYAAPAPLYAIRAPVYVVPRPVFHAPARVVVARPVVVTRRVIVRPIHSVFFARPVVVVHHHRHFVHQHRAW
jgi:hypothetical protein